MKIIHLLSFCLLPAACCLLLFTGCKQSPNDGVPVYMKMDSVRLNTNYSTQGDSSKSITDVWVEANTDNLGAYSLPCNFPVLQEHTVRFTVSAGIKESGQSGVRVIYPFYEPDTFSITAVRGEKYFHQPVFKYKTGAVFSFFNPEQNFELSNNFTGDSLVSGANVKYGNRCASIAVTAADSAHEMKQQDAKAIVVSNQVWLEVDYKCEVPFYIGFYANYSTPPAIRVPVLFVTPKTEWDKVYVNLTALIATARADSYNIYFEALRPQGSTGGTVYIDNVKLIHF